MSNGLVIVGGSQAGLQIAVSARELGYAEPIRLISEEPFLPYQRPPLSKGFLKGEVDRFALSLRAEKFYEGNRIDVALVTRCEKIDIAGRFIEISNDRRIEYDYLALATGARPRKLVVPGAEHEDIILLRTLTDALQLREHIGDARSIAIIGGGFIGLEVASTLVSMGKSVLIIEAQQRLLARAVSSQLSEFLSETHRHHGVDLVFQKNVTRIQKGPGHSKSICCDDGSSYSTDLVIVGIGATPNSELAQASGLLCYNGIIVDQFTRTNHSNIVAAGDCTYHPNKFANCSIRLESIQNAVDQGKCAGALVAGKPRSYDAVPWFWSDQYSLKLQMVGLSNGHDCCILHGSMENHQFSLFYFRAGVLVAIDSVNRPTDHLYGRRLLASAAQITSEQLRRLNFDLKMLLTR